MAEVLLQSIAWLFPVLNPTTADEEYDSEDEDAVVDMETDATVSCRNDAFNLLD